MIYICGDSFAVPDPEYGPCWVDILREKIDQEIVNLSQVCASNLMVSLQVDKVPDNADFIIVLFTASTRSQIRYQNKIVPYSIYSLDNTTPFDDSCLKKLRNHSLEFFDLDLAIYENKCIIESVLSRLEDRATPFLFDQGGFEHHSYGATGKYFDNYQKYRSRYNLWDHAVSRNHRPYYHIQDRAVHNMIADYYAEQICQT